MVVSNTKGIVVAAGVIRDARGRFCLSRRPEHKHQGGLWEFPGGKVEAGETPHQALARELSEELGMVATASTPFLTVEHRYPELAVTLHFREVTAWHGEPRGCEGQPVEWVPLSELGVRAFPAANRPVALALHLPSQLVVVPDGLDRTAVLAGLDRLDGTRQGVYLRSYSDDVMLPQLAERCHERGLRFWVRNDPGLARRVGAFGLHLTASALATLSAPPRFDGVLSAACHDPRQVRRALALGCRMVTVSPVAATATHPHARPIGWDAFHGMIRHTALVAYALGGMGPADVTCVRRHGGFGVAGIGAFWPAAD